jgi:hypothetical protein
MTRTWKAIRRIFTRLLGRRPRALCGYCDIELAGQPTAWTDRYDTVCTQHVEDGEIEDGEIETFDPDAAYDARRDATVGV